MIRTSVSMLIGLTLLGMSCSRKANHGSNDQKPEGGPELPVFKTALVAQDTFLDQTDTLLYYQRSACFGFCPTFHYTVFANGVVRYDGLQHIEPMGQYFALATDAWWGEVKQQINKSHFFDLKDLYPVEPELYIPDLPNTVLIVKEYGLRKKVIDNHHAPKALKDFEIFLEDHFRKLNFVNHWD